MSIQNKNLFLYIELDEKILYVAEKEKEPFFILMLCSLPLTIIMLFGLFIYIFTNNKFSFVDIISYTTLLPLMIFCVYKNVVDYFFIDIILTNKKLVLSRFNKLTPIDYNQIKLITTMGKGFGKMQLNSNETYPLGFIDWKKLKLKIQEIYPSYDDTKEVEEESQKWSIAIVIFALAVPVLLAIYFVISNS